MDETIEQQWEINENATNQELFDLLHLHSFIKNRIEELILTLKSLEKEHHVLNIKIFQYLDNKLNIKETKQDSFLRYNAENLHQTRLIIQEISKKKMSRKEST